ncbi:MAG: hypothetical protein JSU68_05325, partial [Phycisphaerales bacterium]
MVRARVLAILAPRGEYCMPERQTRRKFLAQIGATAAGLALDPRILNAAGPRRNAPPRPRVAIARDDALTTGHVSDHADLLRRLVDAALQKVTDAADATAAWKQLFRPSDRIGIKVNTLGLSTQTAVVDAIVAGLRAAGIAAEKIIVWDRFDVELAQAGYKLNRSGSGVQCRGTDAERIGSGYQQRVETSGLIGS